MELVSSIWKRAGASRAVLKVLPAALLACGLGMANAAVYVPDSFASGPNPGTDFETMVMTKDGTGRVLIGGAFTTVLGQAGFRGVARFNTNDTLDSSFKVLQTILSRPLRSNRTEKS